MSTGEGSKGRAARDPKELFASRLAESGLEPRDAKHLGLKLLTGKQAMRLSPAFAPVPSLRIQYHDERGRATGFYRLRYLEKPPGFKGQVGDPQRYAQPPNTAPTVYLPRTRAWEALLQSSEPLHLTEGELKAACACKHGFPTIALGGVWSWRSAKRGEALIPEIKRWRWKDRTVYIAFDSDSATNPQVARACTELCEALTALGAMPHVVTIPQLEANKKTAIDDLIVSQGREAYAAAVTDSKPFSQAKELWQLNGEVAYIKDPGLVVVMQDGRKLAPQAFVTHAYSNRVYHRQAVRKDGSALIEEEPLARAWLEWPLRAELSRITYAPGQSRVTRANEFNSWRGWGIEPKKGDATPWKELLDHLFGKKREERRWFEAWLAKPLQEPGTKMNTAAVLWGVRKGTGKSLVGYSMGRIYGVNFAEIGEDDLASSFNEWARDRQFVMVDDVASAQTRGPLAERLRTMITRRTLRINIKFLPAYEVPDCVNYYFTANHPDALTREDFERRYFVHEVDAVPRERQFYRRYLDWLDKGGAAALFHHLLGIDASWLHAGDHAPETEAALAMTRDTKSDIASWVERLREDPDGALRLGGAVVSRPVLTTQELLRIYDPDGKTRVTANGLGREMKRAGFRQVNGGKVVWTPQGPQRLYAVRDIEVWLRASPKAIADACTVQTAKAAPKKKRF